MKLTFPDGSMLLYVSGKDGYWVGEHSKTGKWVKISDEQYQNLCQEIPEEGKKGRNRSFDELYTIEMLQFALDDPDRFEISTNKRVPGLVSLCGNELDCDIAVTDKLLHKTIFVEVGAWSHRHWCANRLATDLARVNWAKANGKLYFCFMSHTKAVVTDKDNTEDHIRKNGLAYNFAEVVDFEYKGNPYQFECKTYAPKNATGLDIAKFVGMILTASGYTKEARRFQNVLTHDMLKIITDRTVKSFRKEGYKIPDTYSRFYSLQTSICSREYPDFVFQNIERK